MNNIGIIYHNWKNYDKALEYYQKALNIEDDLDNKTGIAESLNNIAIIYDETGEYNTAIDLYKKSLEIEEIGNKIGISASLSNIGEFYEDRGNYNKAFDYYNKSIKIDKEIDNGVGLGQTYNQLGNLYVHIKQYNKAIKYYNLSSNIVDPLNIIETIIENYKGLGQVYSEIKDYKNAIYFINKYHSLTDSIFNKEMLKRQNNLHADFEIEKKEKEIKLLNSEKIIRAMEINEKQSELRMQRTLLYISFGGIVLFIVFIFLLFRQIKNRNTANKLLNIQNKKIKENRLELLLTKEKADRNIEMVLNSQSLAHICSYSTNLNETDLEKSSWECSPEFYKIFGIDETYPHTIAGWASFIHPDHSEELIAYHEYVVKNRISFSREYKIIRINDGVERWVKGTGELVHDEQGKPVRMHGAIQDITELKKTEDELIKAKEKAEESDRLKSAFLANMSHEIRTPMNGILGFAELLKEPDLTGDQQIKYIDIIEKGGARMLNIINDIVDISRIESNLVNLSTSETDINKKIEYIHAFFKPEAKQKHIKLDYTAPLPTDEANVIIDREKTYAILSNLVKNAIKFTDKGSIEIGYTKKDDNLEFYVKDTGIGIHYDRQEAIFERFIQADVEDKNAYQGAGLGLSISKAYIEMMDGKIWVESEFGKGSTFYFTIPYIVKSNGVQNDHKIITDVDADDIVKKLKVLLVEDDKVSMDFLKIIMGEVQVLFSASNGAEAIKICKDNPDVDLILMDIKMPVMDGFEATQQIRKFNKDVVIIAQTAYGLTGDRVKALEAGCNDYVSKPIEKVKLLEIIKNNF